MLKHRTTDPALRACHIADRLEREHEREHGYEDWPIFWLKTREELLKEFAGADQQPNPGTYGTDYGDLDDRVLPDQSE